MATYVNPDALVTTEWVAQHLADTNLRLLDARFAGLESLPEEYEKEHIPGAVFIDLVSDVGPGALDIRRLEAVMRRLGVSDGITVVIYDQSFGPWAAFVWWLLRYLGHHDARLLDGGLRKWLAEGRATAAGREEVMPGEFVAHPVPALRVGLDEVLEATRAHGALVVDALPGKIYRGEAQMFPTHRAGHIPGAKNISAPSNINRTTNLMLPADELARVWHRLGLTPETKVIVYCGARPYAAFDLFALHLLGHDNAALYDGCWMEWGARSDLPVEVGAER